VISFTPFPILEAENLLLRGMSLADKQDIFSMRADTRMHVYTDTKPDATIADTEAYIRKMLAGVEANQWIIWAIEHKPTRKVIGSVSIWHIDEEQLTGELGYGITPDYQSKGLMKEALLRVIDFGFHSMRLHTLLAYTEEENLHSKKLLQRCGFRFTGQIDEPGSRSEKVFRMDIYQLENKIGV
jgi:[ribosomal protein S5]-alanine N-acetyltransferase